MAWQSQAEGQYFAKKTKFLEVIVYISQHRIYRYLYPFYLKPILNAKACSHGFSWGV